MLVAGLYMLPAADAGGETRTMTLYSVNTKERLTTTYMVNGRHVRSELAKINHLLRDWRRDAVTTIDPKTIDLMWELHADLGSRAPIHIISGYRSVETNAMLRSIGRNVAKRSMHSAGKAIDLYFPDVPAERLRNSALVREVGGVGYYPRSGTSGFVHIDSGRVRHWPGISSSQMARIRRDYRQTVGARLNREPAVMVASADGAGPAAKPAAAAAEKGYPTPTPRPRPLEVLMMAAAQMAIESPAAQSNIELAAVQTTIEPAAAPVPRHNFAAIRSPIQDTLGRDLGRDFGREPGRDFATVQATGSPQSNTSAKGSLVTALRDGIAASMPDIRPFGASAAAGAQEVLSWPAQLLRSAGNLILGGDDGSSPPRGSAPLEEAKNPFPPITEEEAAELEVIVAALSARAQYDAQTRQAAAIAAAAKADRLSINRASKGDLILTAPPPRYGAETATTPADDVAAESFDKLLHASESE